MASGLRCALPAGGACTSIDDGTPKLRREDLAVLADLAGKGKINPDIDRPYARAAIAEAHASVDTGHKRANVVITVS
jgi:D-arabinose 1-dehydrogenase-like Zn-dependent alcohol dehydrogenase